MVKGCGRVLFPDDLVVIRGGGDIATGVVARLHRAGFPVLVCELAAPLTVRRTVAVSSAVAAGSVTVEGIRAVRVDSIDAVNQLIDNGHVPVMVSPELPSIERRVVVDARLAKRNIDTSITDAPLVVGLGPGFTVRTDCHAVIETNRGHRLGRVLWRGSAAPNTGSPGEIGGRGSDRVLRAPVSGEVRWTAQIGDVVSLGAVGSVGDAEVIAPFAGLIRGLIAEGTTVPVGMKIGDIDPRVDIAVDEISDKALAIGGGVVEAVLMWLNR
jgi:xanthine dehydrogenase accessory factor